MIKEDLSLEASCKKVLAIPKIRFVGVIDKMGNKIAGGFKEGVTSYLEDKEDRMMYAQLTLECMMRKDFDNALGQIDYIAARREKVTMISIPMNEYLILISTQRDVNVENIILQVNSAFTLFPDILP